MEHCQKTQQQYVVPCQACRSIMILQRHTWGISNMTSRMALGRTSTQAARTSSIVTDSLLLHVTEPSLQPAIMAVADRLELPSMCAIHRRRAVIAASLHKRAISAATKPWRVAAVVAISCSVKECGMRWNPQCSMARRAASVGVVTSSSRSKRPGRRNAMSTLSSLLVAARTTTCLQGPLQ